MSSLGTGLLGLLLACAVGAAEQDAVRKQSFQVDGFRRSYYAFVPDSAGSAPAALLVLLHGSYGDGGSILGAWTDLANAEGLLLAAPNARERKAWQIRADGPQFIRAVVDEVHRQHPIDRARIYLFGHSGGAVYALTLSMIESQYFAATAVHAGVWRAGNEFVAVPYAKRKIPVAIFVGDKDELFPMLSVRKTHSALEQAGHEVALTVIARHSHDYGKVAADVNRDAWNFLKTKHLGFSQPRP